MKPLSKYLWHHVIMTLKITKINYNNNYNIINIIIIYKLCNLNIILIYLGI